VWAQILHEPVDPGPDRLRVLGIPPEATKAIDTVAREKLRGNPDVDPLDGHKLLCRLKVAAALMRLCNRREITSQDWELAVSFWPSVTTPEDKFRPNWTQSLRGAT
jgi:hypothetical protein